MGRRKGLGGTLHLQLGDPAILQRAFQRSLNLSLLRAKTIEEALAQDFDELFLPVFVTAGA